MDYEKKYNHALEVVRELQKDWASTQNRAAREIELAFPELRESEDERITRAINNMLPFIPDEAYANNGVTKEGVLNWLEKQKEPKHAPDDLQKSFEAGQKSIVDNPEQYGLCKKIEWSEEDETIFDKALDAVYYQDCNDKQDVLYALKGLCDLISKKRKVIPVYQRWKPSEEQMDTLKDAIIYVESSESNFKGSGFLLESLFNNLQKL